MKEINRCWGREQHRAEGIQLVWQVLSEKVTFKLTPEKKRKKKKEIFHERGRENTIQVRGSGQFKDCEGKYLEHGEERELGKVKDLGRDQRMHLC